MAYTSIITLIEVLSKPTELDDQIIIEKFKQFLLGHSQIDTSIIDADLGIQTAKLRANYQLKTPDAIQAAVAIQNNCTLFITNDLVFKRIKEFETIVLSELIDAEE